MKSLLLLTLFLITAFILKTSAQGNLLITPKRVVFEGNKQQAELNLMNTGTDSASYSVSFRRYNMNELGKLVLVEEADSTQMFADPYLRIYPRELTLAPGESQVIMMQLRRKPDMKSGEYRSHIWFRDEKNYEALGKDKTSLDSNQLSVSAIAIFGITIPVIIRVGDVKVGATLSDIKIESGEDSIKYLTTTVNRTGNISINGKLIAEYIPLKGKPYQVGAINVGIYTNLYKRTVTIKLNKMPAKNFNNGKLRVRYISPDDENHVVFAEDELELNNRK